MMQTTAVVIGAGHAGLAMSRRVTERSIDHVALERGEVANSWRTRRWPSLRLLTPNWLTRLPGYDYAANDPNGCLPAAGVVSTLTRFAERYDQIDDLTRARHLPSPQLTGTPEPAAADLNTLTAQGIRLVGRLGVFVIYPAAWSSHGRIGCPMHNPRGCRSRSEQCGARECAAVRLRVSLAGRGNTWLSGAAQFTPPGRRRCPALPWPAAWTAPS
jgi:hypothetical protein